MAPARKSTKKSASRKSRSKASGRKAPAKPSKKASTRKAASKKAASRKAAPKKSAPKKKTVAKAASKKKAAAKAPKAAPSKGKTGLKAAKGAKPDTRGGRRAPAIRSRKKKQPHVKPPALTGTPSGRHSKLGTKWACYGCGAKFYDLNQPEPLCPRCGADQREKPKDAPTPPPPPPPKREPRSLAPYLDDDDAATRNESLSTEDLDLELGAIADDEDVDKPPTLGLDNAEDAADED